MLFGLSIAVALLQLPSLNAQALDANGISLEEKVLAIERLMLTPGTIDFQVAPCKFLLNGPPPEIAGEQTSAHWIRTAFHDFITADVAAGTGGLDASIGYETLRAENEGTIAFDGLNFASRTIIGFNLFSNVFISTADFIALGVAETLLSCDHESPMMELRAGRIDATCAGPFGVPQPFESLSTHTAQFAKAGFNSTEMIQAIACGHTIGGVHGTTFPGIVGNDPVVGMSETDFFDDSPYLFDVAGIQNYLSSTGKAGGPLVNSANTTLRSDRRIFTSDNNATVTAMAASQAVFRNTCIKIFNKMINTVPAGQTLSAPIGPRQWITMYGYVDFSGSNIKYFGRAGTYSKTGSPLTASFRFGTTSNSGVPGLTATKQTQPGVPADPMANNIPGGERFPFFGNTTFYEFNDTISTTTTSLSIQGVYNETVNTKLFVVPSLTFRDPSSGPKYLVRAALLTSLAPSGTTLTGTLYYPAGQTDSESPVYKQVTATLTYWKKKGSYSLFQGTIVKPSDLPSNGGGEASIDVKLGTTLRSQKLSWSSLVPITVADCSKADLTQCP